MLPLVLASSSIYRRHLLERLHLDFTCSSPDIDESRQPGATAREMVCSLAVAKPQALRPKFARHLIIGSDQVAVLGEQILGKPHDLQRAQAQLVAASGRSVTFLTGVALFNSASGNLQVDCVPFTVHFRQLDESAITRYLLAEQPFDCAGSFKSEGLGISLFRRTEGSDASSLIGLPLIRLIDMLHQEGLHIP